MSFDLDATRIVELLDELDLRLRDAGVAASIYGRGAAPPSRCNCPAQDDARTISTSSWMTPELLTWWLRWPKIWGYPTTGSTMLRPHTYRADPRAPATPPDGPGLRVVLASLQHLLAMKLAAGRARDRADTVTLSKALGVDDPETAVQVTVSAYGEDALEVFTTIEDVRHEAEALLGQHPPDQR